MSWVYETFLEYHHSSVPFFHRTSVAIHHTLTTSHTQSHPITIMPATQHVLADTNWGSCDSESKSYTDTTYSLYALVSGPGLSSNSVRPSRHSQKNLNHTNQILKDTPHYSIGDSFTSLIHMLILVHQHLVRPRNTRLQFPMEYCDDCYRGGIDEEDVLITLTFNMSYSCSLDL